MDTKKRYAVSKCIAAPHQCIGHGLDKVFHVFDVINILIVLLMLHGNGGVQSTCGVDAMCP